MAMSLATVRKFHKYKVTLEEAAETEQDDVETGAGDDPFEQLSGQLKVLTSHLQVTFRLVLMGNTVCFAGDELIHWQYED